MCFFFGIKVSAVYFFPFYHYFYLIFFRCFIPLVVNLQIGLSAKCLFSEERLAKADVEESKSGRELVSDSFTIAKNSSNLKIYYYKKRKMLQAQRTVTRCAILAGPKARSRGFASVATMKVDNPYTGETCAEIPLQSLEDMRNLSLKAKVRFLLLLGRF